MKISKKFDIVKKSRPISTPCVYNNFDDGVIDEKYPLRSLIGAVQYVACIVRPDIMFAVNRVARHANKPTTAVITAAKRIV